MRVDVLTLFPNMFEGPMNTSMSWKARDRGLLDLHLHDIRDYSQDKHRSVDDTPYGGGGGMVLKADVLVPAIEAVRALESAPPAESAPEPQIPAEPLPVILMSPQGRVFNHDIAVELSRYQRLILVCGHYEGFDERVRDLVVTDEISIGDYVLTGGELAAMVVIDAVIRHIPGVLGAEGGADRDSHADGLLEGPHYTRPMRYRGLDVPDVLKNGNHGEIERWRRLQSIRRTWRNRPELLRNAQLSDAERDYLAELAEEDTAALRATQSDSG